MAKPKNLPHPITTTVDGVPMTLATIGRCAHALRRTTACLKQWERKGIFPPAPYRSTRNQRRLYPLDFISGLGLIAEQDYFGPRLERANWPRFKSDIWAAHDAALQSLQGETDGVGSLTHFPGHLI
jgi:hypothetical protein